MTALQRTQQSNQGILPFFRVRTSEDGFRCAACKKFQMPSAKIVWVPDSIINSGFVDSVEAMAEICRQSDMNGFHSGCCVKCSMQRGK